jgi:S-adenosylmethionine synthetase
MNKGTKMKPEIIELKSNGHPDTLTDLIVESCATGLDKYYNKKYGKILHYNVDKAVFLAGNAKVEFGGGNILKSPCFILGGQVSNFDSQLKKELKLVIKNTIHHHLPNLHKFRIEIRCNNVSSNLLNISENKEILCNDTSFGVGYYPFSKNENKVFAIRDTIDRMIKEQIIPIGELYKIMLTPKGIYVSAPLYAQRVHSREEYAMYKKKIENELKQYGNVVFDPEFEHGFPYMTLTGSSIECGDDGAVGRGNRYNGLITPCRPMTMEAYCGKNNKNHIGKIYQRLAFEKAKEIYEQTGKSVEIIIVGKIGCPINDYELYVNHNI